MLPTDNFDIELSNFCEGSYAIRDCQPVYVSVEGMIVPSGQGYRCSEPECLSPDSIKYGIQVDNIGCFSAANSIINCKFLTILLFIPYSFINFKFQ